MTEIQIHLESMRNAADKMRYSAQSMYSSVSTVRAFYVTLPADMQAAIAAEMGHLPHLNGVEWLDMLSDFARKLDKAAYEIEHATFVEDAEASGKVDSLPAANTGRTFGDYLPRILNINDDKPFEPLQVKETVVFGSYVNEFNRPVYEELMRTKDDLREKQERLAYLNLMREDRVAELQALENRLASEGVTNINAIPRVQVMQSDIERIDQEMRGIETDMASINENLQNIHERLSRISPGAGANLDIIRELEKSETMDAIKQNTYGCVNHIVNKMPIPPGIANDGYLWNDNAATYAEYGITSGDVPLPGSVIVFEREHSWADSQYGHLMYVERVEDGEIWITDNYHPDEAVRLSDITSEVSGENVTYLYFPWHTRVR